MALVTPEDWYKRFWLRWSLGMLVGFYVVQVLAYLTAVWLMKRGWV